MPVTREWLHIGNTRRLGHVWATLPDALADRDPFQDAVPCWQRITDKPLADYGLTSYRYKGRFGWIMIGARDTAEALSEAKRSTQDVDVARLEVWNGYSYVAVE